MIFQFFTFSVTVTAASADIMVPLFFVYSQSTPNLYNSAYSSDQVDSELPQDSAPPQEL